MKVLIFISSIDLTGGGPSRSVPMLVKGLAEAGLDATLMTIRSEYMNTHALEKSNAKIKVLERRVSSNELENFILSENFDLSQMQSMWSTSYHRIAQII